MWHYGQNSISSQFRIQSNPLHFSHIQNYKLLCNSQTSKTLNIWRLIWTNLLRNFWRCFTIMLLQMWNTILESDRRNKGPWLKDLEILNTKHWTNFLLSNIVLILEVQLLLYGLSAAQQEALNFTPHPTMTFRRIITTKVVNRLTVLVGM